MRFRKSLSVALCAVVVGAFGAGAAAYGQESVEDFYRGRTIDLIIGYSPGGGYDHYARLVARFLPRFIPGNPNIVPRNMPGGGTRTAAAFIFNVAPKDGTVLGTFDQGLPLEQVMGDTTIQINTAEFNWIGTPATANNVLVTWHTTGITDIEQAKETRLSLGSTGSGGAVLYPLVLNDRLGTQFDIIAGYPGGTDINFAMEGGEVDGRGSNSWASYKLTNPDWVQNDLINVLVQFGLEREPDLPDVPLLIDLAENDEDRALFHLLSAPVAVGRPIVTTPGVPQDRLDALRDAFAAMVQDPEFLATAEAENLEISPLLGEELQEVVEGIVNADPAIVQQLVEINASYQQ